MAKHRTTGKRYVVKLLPLETRESAIASGRAMNLPCDPMSMTDDDARRVVAEAEVLKLASDHPNVVRFHGAFRRDVPPSSSSRRTSEHLASGDASVPASRGDPSRDSTAAPSPSSPRASELCIVMSHCEGGDLASLLRRVKQAGPHALLPEDAVMRWLVQLLLGLNHIHRKAILHRDIKPANVFLSKSRKVVRLGDFGIAKKLREDDDLATTVVGTPLYMSPELCQGKPYTYASDIWALGCVAYEMASGGAKAFDAPGWPQLLVKIVRGDYAPVPSHLSRPFAALVASMLSPDPAERPTAEQLLGTPIVRRHCEALLRDARDAKRESAESAADDRAAEPAARPGRTPRASAERARAGKAFARPGRRSRHHRRAFWWLRVSGAAVDRASRRFSHVSAAAAADAEKRAPRRRGMRRGRARCAATAWRCATPTLGAWRRATRRTRTRRGAWSDRRLARRRRRRRRSSWRGDTRRRRDAKRRASAFFSPERKKKKKKKKHASAGRVEGRRRADPSRGSRLQGGPSRGAKPRSRRARGWNARRWARGVCSRRTPMRRLTWNQTRSGGRENATRPRRSLKTKKKKRRPLRPSRRRRAPRTPRRR